MCSHFSSRQLKAPDLDFLTHIPKKVVAIIKFFEISNCKTYVSSNLTFAFAITITSQNNVKLVLMRLNIPSIIGKLLSTGKRHFNSKESPSSQQNKQILVTFAFIITITSQNCLKLILMR
jgi:hypothetical protein